MIFHHIKNDSGKKGGDAGDRTRGLSHAKRTLYRWATSPSRFYQAKHLVSNLNNIVAWVICNFPTLFSSGAGIIRTPIRLCDKNSNETWQLVCILPLARWSRGMILASGARGPGLNSQSSPSASNRMSTEGLYIAYQFIPHVHITSQIILDHDCRVVPNTSRMAVLITSCR